MPFVSSVICQKCEHITEDILFKSYEDMNSKIQKMCCSKENCHGNMARYLGDCATNSFIGENNDPVSSKPSSYWRNAERNRLNSQRKKIAVDLEKKRYGDKSSRK